METIRKTFLVLSASCISILSFSQAGLGVTSSTRAAARASINTNAAQSTLKATNHAATKTLNATSSKAMEVSGNSVTAAEAKTKGALKTTRAEKAKLRKNVNTGVEAEVKSQGSFETGVNHSSENADAGIQVATDAQAKGDVDGEKPIHKVNQVADEKRAMAKEKKDAAKEKANSTKMKTKKELKRTKREIKNTVPRASAEAHAEAKVHASSNSAVQN